jgi:hypothetical protein
MLEPLPIDLAGHRHPSERTHAINAALATLQPAKPKHAPTTTRNPHARVLRQLIASFKPPPRDPSILPLHAMERAILPAEGGGEDERAPPSLVPA